MRRAMCDVRRAMCDVRRATYGMRHATCDMRHATCDMQRVSLDAAEHGVVDPCEFVEAGEEELEVREEGLERRPIAQPEDATELLVERRVLHAHVHSHRH